MRLLKLLSAAAVAIAAIGGSAFADEGRFVVLFNKNKLPNNFEAKIENAGGAVALTLPEVGVVIATSSDANFADNIKADRAVSDSGPEAVHTLPDTTAAAGPNTAPTAADDIYNAGLVWGVDRVGAPAAWANGHTGSHNTVVAVVDTGIASNHPDLAPNIVDMKCFASIPCLAYPSFSDHGTHVAGTVGAAFGGGRVVGVAPEIGLAGYNVFEPIAGCGVCAFSSSRWAAMIDAANSGYEVVTMSLGGTAAFGGQGTEGLAAFVQAEKRVAKFVNKAGTVMVASAGNGGLDVNGTIIHVPGDIPRIVNVGATGIQPAPRFPFANSFDIRAFYSNYGASALTIAGPGGDCGEISTCSGNPGTGFPWFEYLVLSSIVAPDPACAATASCATGYGWKGGTSMATPHVSGTAALIRDANPGLGPNDVEEILKNTAENIGSQQEFGHGMVRADLATQ